MHSYITDVNLQTDTDTFFVIVGGISIMTILINGMTSGPLLSAVRTIYFLGNDASVMRNLTFTYFYSSLALLQRSKLVAK